MLIPMQCQLCLDANAINAAPMQDKKHKPPCHYIASEALEQQQQPPLAAL
jgi:hypothetical protein